MEVRVINNEENSPLLLILSVLFQLINGFYHLVFELSFHFLQSLEMNGFFVKRRLPDPFSLSFTDRMGGKSSTLEWGL